MLRHGYIAKSPQRVRRGGASGEAVLAFRPRSPGRHAERTLPAPAVDVQAVDRKAELELLLRVLNQTQSEAERLQAQAEAAQRRKLDKIIPDDSDEDEGMQEADDDDGHMVDEHDRASAGLVRLAADTTEPEAEAEATVETEPDAIADPDVDIVLAAVSDLARIRSDRPAAVLEDVEAARKLPILEGADTRSTPSAIPVVTRSAAQDTVDVAGVQIETESKAAGGGSTCCAGCWILTSLLWQFLLLTWMPVQAFCLANVFYSTDVPWETVVIACIECMILLHLVLITFCCGKQWLSVMIAWGVFLFGAGLSALAFIEILKRGLGDPFQVNPPSPPLPACARLVHGILATPPAHRCVDPATPWAHVHCRLQLQVSTRRLSGSG